MKDKKKSINVFSIIISILLAIIILNIASIFELQLNNDFQLELTKSMIFQSVFSISTYINIFKIDTPVSLMGIMASIVVVYKINFGIIKSNSYEESYEYGSHGTARFKDKYEINELSKDSLGWFLGSIEPNQIFTIEDVKYEKK